MTYDYQVYFHNGRYHIASDWITFCGQSVSGVEWRREHDATIDAFLNSDSIPLCRVCVKFAPHRKKLDDIYTDSK